MKCDEVITLDDIHLIEGSYKSIEFPCYNEEGLVLDLAGINDFGCTFSYYGEESVLAFDVKGTIKDGTYNIMEVEILSSHTKQMGDTVLVYCPYLVMGNKVIRPAQGRVIIYSAYQVL